MILGPWLDCISFQIINIAERYNISSGIFHFGFESNLRLLDFAAIYQLPFLHLCPCQYHSDLQHFPNPIHMTERGV